MDITATNLKLLYTGISTVFNETFANTKTYYPTIAMTVQSTTAANQYPKMDDLPGIREWLGDRVVHSLSAQTYTISNRKFESTIALSRDQVEDDQIGFFKNIVAQFAQNAARFPDELVFPLFKNGDKNRCYDGQYFFDEDHPNFNESGGEVTVSNILKGDKPAWYLIDDTQVMRPIIYQERKSFKLVNKDQERDGNVFEQDAFIYGVDGRCNAGFGLWQLAFKATVDLNAENYAQARTKMAAYRRRDGSALGINPTKLLVPPVLEAQARKLLNAELINGGESNIWRGSAELVVIPYL